MSSIFDKMITDFRRQDAQILLEECMSLNPRRMKKVPVRYRIIALGFIRHMSLDELNGKLLEAGCETLYSRDFLEAGLMYAFANQMPYEKWKELYQSCRDSIAGELRENACFQAAGVTYGELKQYVRENSILEDADEAEQVLHTERVTRRMEEGIRSLTGDEEKFRDFLLHNIREFSVVREKSRYYFCKYLYYYIEERIGRYLQAAQSDFGRKQAYEELWVLRGIKDLIRKKLSREQILEQTEKATLSFRHIYDDFNYFYFEYVSNDWLQVLLEQYGEDLLMLDPHDRRFVADALRRYQPQWKEYSDDQVLREKCRELEQQEAELDAEYSREGASRGYQKNRSGEKSVRNYIKGNLDIDRTTLICYLLFFSHDVEVHKSQAITPERLDAILEECRFPRLNQENDFDYFVLQYLNAEDPAGYLMETVTEYAFRNQNFYLYHMYGRSVSHHGQEDRIFGE